MGRMNLSGMTPDERLAHQRGLANLRKQRERKKSKDAKSTAKALATFNFKSAEVLEFVDGIKELPLSATVELVAAWEREYKQPLPIEYFTELLPNESNEEYRKRDGVRRKFLLVRMLATGFYARQQARIRKKLFLDREIEEASRLGISHFELQKRKQFASWKAKKKETQTKRELDRLFRKSNDAPVS